MANNKTLELSIKIAGKMDKSLMAALNGSQSQISSFARSISSIGTAGLAAMGTLATATVATIASCTKEAAKFENYMADVVKYVDGLADATGKISDKVADNGKTYAQNYEAMKDAIKDLSTQIPYTQEDLTRLAAAAGQSGKSMEDLIKIDSSGNVTGFLRDIAMTGAAMDISADQAGNWAAKWEQSLKMTHEEVMVLFDQINYLGANSATTAAEIAEAVNSAASLGQVGGVSAATTAALADAMLATGVSTDRVGTSIKRMIVNLSKGASATKAQKEQFEEMGMSAEWVAKAMQEDSVGTLDTIFKAINDLPQERQVAALSTLFGQWAIEGGAKIVNNLDVYRKALEMVSDPSLYTGSMEREFKLTMPLRQGIAGIGAAATIQGSIFQQGLSGLLGKAGGVVSGIANSGAGKAVGSIFSGGAGLLGSIYGPIAGGLGGLLSGALPIVGVISSIIAVVSILTDKFGGLDKIVQRVFGDTGLEKFTVFKDALLGLFEDGGVAKALQPLQESITNLFGEDAGAAFGGITTILQSVMGVIGQLVTFSQTTVRPIIESIFGFITQTVVPVILQTITAAAPSIASIISGVGSVVMTVAQIIGEAIQFLMPIIQTVITVLLHIGQVVVPAVLAAIGVFAEGISSAINGVKTIFEGVINFITGVFSGNWRMAWEGVKSIFVGIFDTLGALFKTPINAVIALINKAIAGINSLGITIPDWVPLLGGKSFSINIPEIPMLARGGFTNGASIAGEAGTEAVISFQRAARRDNLDIWAKAGQMLGVKPVELAEIDGGGSGGGGDMTFAPVINIQGNADRSMVEEALAEAQARFEAWYLQMQRRQARTAY